MLYMLALVPFVDEYSPLTAANVSHLFLPWPVHSFAFVVVSSAEDVARAIQQLNRGKVAGRQISVKDSRNSYGKWSGSVSLHQAHNTNVICYATR